MSGDVICMLLVSVLLLLLRLFQLGFGIVLIVGLFFFSLLQPGLYLNTIYKFHTHFPSIFIYYLSKQYCLCKCSL